MVRLVLLVGVMCALSSFAWADDVSIHCMAVGDRILEVQENRQLTFKADGKADCPSMSPDGKTVAYFLENGKSTSLCLVRSSGGKPTVVLSGPTEPDFPPVEQRETKGEVWSLGSASVEWSPDGKLMVIQGTHCAWDGRQETQTDCALVLAANGAYVRTFVIPGSALGSGVRFCPDSNTIVATQPSREPSGDGTDRVKVSSKLLLFDVASGSTRKIDLGPGIYFFERWSDGGQSIIYTCMTKGEHSLRKVWLDGRPAEAAGPKMDIDTEVSPDGRFQADSTDDGVTIKDIGTGKTVRMLKDSSAMAQTWSPDSQMLFYSQSLIVKDAAEQRSQELSSLWVMTMATGKMGTMCIAPEFDMPGSVSPSRNGRRVAYTSDSRLYVAELELRKPTAAESTAAGLPLTEENVRELVTKNADDVAAALLSLAAKNEGFPSAATIEEALKAELKDMETPDALYFPGTQRSIFKFKDPGVKWSEIQEQDRTVIGELDAGYGWKVLIYADSSTKVVEK